MFTIPTNLKKLPWLKCSEGRILIPSKVKRTLRIPGVFHKHIAKTRKRHHIIFSTMASNKLLSVEQLLRARFTLPNAVADLVTGTIHLDSIFFKGTALVICGGYYQERPIAPYGIAVCSPLTYLKILKDLNPNFWEISSNFDEHYQPYAIKEAKESTSIVNTIILESALTLG